MLAKNSSTFLPVALVVSTCKDLQVENHREIWNWLSEPWLNTTTTPIQPVAYLSVNSTKMLIL
jgi:hypothetical protein